jgi:hypothetical protein
MLGASGSTRNGSAWSRSDPPPWTRSTTTRPYGPKTSSGDGARPAPTSATQPAASLARSSRGRAPSPDAPTCVINSIAVSSSAGRCLLGCRGIIGGVQHCAAPRLPSGGRLPDPGGRSGMSVSRKASARAGGGERPSATNDAIACAVSRPSVMRPGSSERLGGTLGDYVSVVSGNPGAGDCEHHSAPMLRSGPTDNFRFRIIAA